MLCCFTYSAEVVIFLFLNIHKNKYAYFLPNFGILLPLHDFWSFTVTPSVESYHLGDVSETCVHPNAHADELSQP